MVDHANLKQIYLEYLGCLENVTIKVTIKGIGTYQNMYSKWEQSDSPSWKPNIAKLESIEGSILEERSEVCIAVPPKRVHREDSFLGCQTKNEQIEYSLKFFDIVDDVPSAGNRKEDFPEFLAWWSMLVLQRSNFVTKKGLKDFLSETYDPSYVQIQPGDRTPQ